jgi:hypothetical protein
MEEFFTRQRANDGVKLPLYHPDGSVSDHWMVVRGIDSDIFREAEAQARRQAIEIVQIEDKAERDSRIRESELSCIAVLVADWSFESECTVENVIKFLREAPQIADMVNRFAARRSEFFAKKSNSSVHGSKQSLSSKRPRKARKLNSETT